MSLKRIAKDVVAVTKTDERTVLRLLRAFFDVLAERFVQGQDRFVVPGLGSFYLLHSKARKNRNPNSGEIVLNPPKTTLRFKSSVKLVEALNRR